PHLETSGAGAAPARQPGRRDPGVLLGLSGDPRSARAAQPRRRGPADRGLRAGASRKPRPALHAVLAGSDRTARYRVGQRQAGSVGVAAVKPVSSYFGVVTGCSSGPPFPSDGSSGPPSSLQLNDILPSAPAITRCASAG